MKSFVISPAEALSVFAKATTDTRPLPALNLRINRVGG